MILVVWYCRYKNGYSKIEFGNTTICYQSNKFSYVLKTEFVIRFEFLRNTGIRAKIIQRFEILWISNTTNDILWFILFIILMGGGNWTKVVLISSITGYMCVIIKILGSMQRLTYWPSSSFNYWNVFMFLYLCRYH